MITKDVLIPVPEKRQAPASLNPFAVARRAAVGLVLAYVVVIMFLMLPMIQTYTIYAHHIDAWGYSKFEHPEHYGLAPGKTVNMNLSSSDNTTIGSWFIFSDPFYRTLPHPHLHSDSAEDSNHPLSAWQHGNPSTQAAHDPVLVAHSPTWRQHPRHRL
ncbi:hypothetical protein H1R20_g16025, partial [Candolleomyces eurysporus]